MLKSIYVKQNFNSVIGGVSSNPSSVTNQNNRQHSFFDKRHNGDKHNHDSSLIDVPVSEVVTPIATSEYISRSDSTNKNRKA